LFIRKICSVKITKEIETKIICFKRSYVPGSYLRLSQFAGKTERCKKVKHTKCFPSIFLPAKKQIETFHLFMIQLQQESARPHALF
jgi:hypothetical protein